MSVAVVQRLLAFFGNVWSFILTLVRSLLALFSFRRRRTSSNPFSLPTTNRTPDDALARAHSQLRPILLTPKSITLSRAQSTRTRSATSTLLSAHSENPIVAVSVPQAGAPQRTSPKLDPHDPELGLIVVLSDLPGPPAVGATSFRQGTPDTSDTGSLYVSPLTPPDRCYLAPLPAATDCPYTESWPATVSLERGKPRLPGSPLKVSINTGVAFPEPMVVPIGSPPPAHWSPVHIWTSTPCKNDNPVLSDPAFSPFDLSHALISRSQSSIRPYSNATNLSATSDATPPAEDAHHQRHRANALVPRSKDEPFPRFHHPDAYACMWRRHGARLPGRTHACASSRSHADLGARAWYGADAYVPSPVVALSPSLSDAATEDEDDMPLGRLKERLARQGTSADADAFAGAGLSVSPRTRRMSEGCLLAMSASTPTRVGLGGRQALSMALDCSGNGVKDWLEALSLQFPSEQKGAVLSVDAVAS